MYPAGLASDLKPKPQSWVLTSPDWQRRYHKDVNTTQTVRVPEGFTIRFAWTNFDTGPSDYVQIVDGDRTELTPKLSMLCKTGGVQLPPPGVSNSNIIHVKFNTDSYDQDTGWRMEWGTYFCPYFGDGGCEKRKQMLVLPVHLSISF